MSVFDIDRSWVLTLDPNTQKSEVGKTTLLNKTRRGGSQMSCQVYPVPMIGGGIYRVPKGLGPKVRSYPW